jgi:hypothetical protein
MSKKSPLIQTNPIFLLAARFRKQKPLNTRFPLLKITTNIFSKIEFLEIKNLKEIINDCPDFSRL